MASWVLLGVLMTMFQGHETKSTPLRIGYVPMTDCAPLVVAQENGFFEDNGLEVELIREPGWATVREKMYLGELDAAQAPASMVLELSLGFTGLTRHCITGFYTAHNGNAITLSNELWDLGVRDGDSLRKVITEHYPRRFTFAGVLKYSSQNYLMRHWLLSHGIVPEKDVDMIMVPPPQVHTCLKNGYIDGYCVAEPWSSVGLLQDIGWCVSLTSEFSPMHPEKVFMVTNRFHRENPERHLAILRALWTASEYCDDPANRPALAHLLSRKNYLDLPTDVIANALVGPFVMGKGKSLNTSDTIVFHDDDANRPNYQKAAWLLDQISIHKLQDPAMRPTKETVLNCFREDIYDDLISSLTPLNRN